MGTSGKCTTQEIYDEFTSIQEFGGSQSMNKVSFDYLINKEGVSQTAVQLNSKLMSDYYMQSGIGCWKHKNQQQCQALANLCVSTLYKDNAQCSFFRKKIAENGGQGFIQGAPWIEFSEKTMSLLKTPLENFNFKPSFYEDKAAGRSIYLKYRLALYSVNGTYLGMTDLQGQLNSCRMTYQDVLNTKRFGVITQSSCDLYLNDFVYGDAPSESNIFFEMFVMDNDNNMIEVPVLINQTDKLASDPSDDWKLVRRFFMYDTLSGMD